MKKMHWFIAIAFTVSLIFSTITSQTSEARKKKPTKPAYVGALKCDSSCHDPWYLAWSETPHAKSYELLKPGKRPEAKKKAKLDPEKDYSQDPQCLRCHTTGYKQAGGFKDKTAKKPTRREDPDEPNLAAVGCEMCHSVNGGALFRVIMKEEKEKFKRVSTEAVGQRFDYENVCKRCHEHPNTPFQPSLDPKYKFNYEERKKKVHDFQKFYNEDNKDQLLTKDKNGVSVHAPGNTEKNPLPIENWKIVDGKFKKKVWPVWDKKEKKIVWKGIKK